MKRYVFDFETYRNFCSVVYVDVDTKDIQTFIISENQNDKDKITEFVNRDILLIGYNSISYDAPLLRYITNYTGKDINEDLFKLSSRLIDENRRNDRDIYELRYAKEGYKWYNQDLMALLGFDKIGVSLKLCAIALNWKKVQDLPFPPNHIIRQEDVPTILTYNENDGFITLELYSNSKVKEIRKLREAVTKEYGIDMLSSSDSSMANLLLERMYSLETGLEPSQFKKLRSPKKAIAFKQIILPVINFETPELQNLKNEMMDVVVFEEQKFKYSKIINFKGNTYNLGIGGLHTDEKPVKYSSDKEIKIVSLDVRSFYPSIMTIYNIKPEHIDKKFIDILKRLTSERVEAKKTKDKVKSESYKIVVNSTFGKTGYNNHWLYDPSVLLGVTLNGQLVLLMLIEKLELAGIKVISSNTDGIEIKVPIKLENEYLRVTKEWEEKTGFVLEHINYKLYVKRDVNNYVAVDEDGKIKTKGIFIPETGISVPFKAYRSPIIGKALCEYFVKGIPVSSTIHSSKDIFNFCISQKSAKEFVMEYRTAEKTTILQKTNRFFISTTGGSLLKRKGGDSKYTAGLYVGEHVTILNDYDENKSFESYPIKFEFYEREAQKIIDEIEPKVIQPTLFQETDLNLSAIRQKITCPQTENTIEKIIKQSNGKRFEDAIAASVKNRETFKGINPRWVYVMNVDLRYSPKIEVYPFHSGNIQTLKIQKRNYHPLIVGNLIYCTDFEKRPEVKMIDGQFVENREKFVWWLTSYHIANEEEFKKSLS